MKKNIDLIVNGVKPEKVMYDTDNHSLVVLYPEQNEFKIGDKVKFKKDLPLRLGWCYDGVAYANSMLPINNALLTVVKIDTDGIVTCSNDMNKDSWDYRPEWLEHVVKNKMEFKRGDVLKSKGSDAIFILDAVSPKHEDEEWCSSIIGLNFQGILVQRDTYCWGSIHNARLATPEEQQILFDALKKEGKKWNKETLEIEDLDISEIVYNLSSACSYLNKSVPDFKSLLLTISNEDFHKYKAQITLQLIRKAWNKFDGFEADWESPDQYKHYPTFEVEHGKIEFLGTSYTSWILDSQTSNFSFKTEERATQFGNQFKELFKIALGL